MLTRSLALDADELTPPTPRTKAEAAKDGGAGAGEGGGGEGGGGYRCAGRRCFSWGRRHVES
eukprot:COSAG01_NODE_27369_length_687_cov_2.093537_1_plen_62_part_00